MNLDSAEFIKRYQDIAEAYNKSSLAVDEGWFFNPDEFSALELKTILKYLPGKDAVFLDIGTGKGIAPIFIQKLGARSISVDSFAAAGVSAVRNVRSFGVEGFHCELGTEPIPIKNDSVDCVFFGDVIEHLLHSPKPVLREIYRVLKPGGVCVASTPNATRLTVRLKVFLGYSNWANIDEYFDKEYHAGHHHEYTIAEFKNVFQKTNFSIEDFIMFESSLKTVKIDKLDDMGTRCRSKDKPLRERCLIRLGKKLLFCATQIDPKLRSNMLLVAKKGT